MGGSLLLFRSNEKTDDRRDQHLVHRLGALAARLGLQGLQIGEVVSQDVSFQANETEASPSASMTATPGLARR